MVVKKHHLIIFDFPMILCKVGLMVDSTYEQKRITLLMQAP